jgi:ATP-dependent Clp protease ATP-binding subunit ClpC
MKTHFSTQLKEVISFSAEEAMRLQTGVITPAHLVLGMIRQAANPALTILTTGFGLSATDLKTRVEAMVAPGPPPRRRGFLSRVSLPLDRDSEAIIRRSVKEAAKLKNQETGGEHLLLALLGGPAGELVHLFSNYGVSYASVYEKVGRHD